MFVRLHEEFNRADKADVEKGDVFRVVEIDVYSPQFVGKKVRRILQKMISEMPWKCKPGYSYIVDDRTFTVKEVKGPIFNVGTTYIGARHTITILSCTVRWYGTYYSYKIAGGIGIQDASEWMLTKILKWIW